MEFSQRERGGFLKKWRYLVPGFVFQSIVIGGGYGTGAEITAFFAGKGMAGGLLAMLVTTVTWSVLCGLTFEFVRVFRCYDYHTLMRQLLGRYGALYELCYLIMLLMVLGVINATAGTMLRDLLGLPVWFGSTLLSAAVFFLASEGTQTIEKALSFWSWILYAVFGLFLLAVLLRFGGSVQDELVKFEVHSGWSLSGLRYAFYNLGVIPALLYTVREVTSRREAVLCGVLAGVMGILPALLLLLAMGCDLSGAIAAEVPVSVVFEHLDMKWLHLLFQLVLLGTLVETGAGYIKALNDRVETSLLRKRGSCPPQLLLLVTGASVLLGLGVSGFGLTELISQGYGSICWGFFAFYALPMLTVGVHQLKQAKR